MFIFYRLKLITVISTKVGTLTMQIDCESIKIHCLLFVYLFNYRIESSAVFP